MVGGGRREGSIEACKATLRTVGHLASAPGGAQLPGGRRVRDLFRGGQALLPGRLGHGRRAALSDVCGKGTGGGLYAAGWEKAKKARLGEVLEKAYDDGLLSALEWGTYRELADLRNSHAHFRKPGSPTSLLARTIEEDALGTEVLAKDARCAVQAMARIVRRQTGGRVALDPPDE